jgi:hypothetical protein
MLCRAVIETELEEEVQPAETQTLTDARLSGLG